MFLKRLSNPLQKALFLELAMLMMMASGDKAEASEHILNSQMAEDEKVKSLLSYIGPTEEKMIGEYAQELKDGQRLFSHFFNSLADFSQNENSFDKNFRNHYSNYDFNEKELFGDNSSSFLKNLKSVLGEMERDHFPSLKSVLENSCKEVLAQYASDAEIKKEVIQTLLENGEDILDLNPEKIQSVMAGLPVVRQKILERAVFWAVAPKQSIGLDLSEQDKKIILCELVGAGFSSGAFEPEEKALLLKICEILEIDAEYIDEFGEAMEKLFRINKELSDLINE